MLKNRAKPAYEALESCPTARDREKGQIAVLKKFIDENDLQPEDDQKSFAKTG